MQAVVLFGEKSSDEGNGKAIDLLSVQVERIPRN